jgi:hypothetical protein
MTLTIHLTPHQLQKLQALAKARTQEAKGRRVYTVERCIQDFAESCQPGGDGWVHPSKKR